MKEVCVVEEAMFALSTSTLFPGEETYMRRLIDAVSNALPESLKGLRAEAFIEAFDHELPLVKLVDEPAGRIHITIVSPHRHYLGCYYNQLLTHWLLPGNLVNLDWYFCTDFHFPNLSDERYIFFECAITESDEALRGQMRSNFESLRGDIVLGLRSFSHSRQVMESRGANLEMRTAIVQECIGRLISKYPHKFSQELLEQLKRFFVVSSLHFRQGHSSFDLARLICIFHHFKSEMRKKLAQRRSQRIVKVWMRPNLKSGRSTLVVGINFLRENERFSQKHLLLAVKRLYASANLHPSSYFYDWDEQIDGTRLRIIHVEVDLDEPLDRRAHARIKSSILSNVHTQVEQLIQPVFMPRNEEEVLKNMLILSDQIRSVNDLPQVTLSLEKRTMDRLTFNVVLARPLARSKEPLSEILAKVSDGVDLEMIRVREMGRLRKRYPKEVCVFHAHLPSIPYVRQDYSIDVYKARTKVLSALEGVLGELRDYNGGMYVKQMEVFAALKRKLGAFGEDNDFLLENFFHAIDPPEARGFLEPEPLAALFRVMTEVIKRREGVSVSSSADWICFAEANDSKESRSDFLALKEEGMLLSVSLHDADALYCGYLFFCRDQARMREIRALVLQNQRRSRSE